MKYLTDKERKFIKNSSNDDNVKIDELLDTMEVDGKICFYENKHNGKIFDSKSEIIGVMNDGTPKMFN